MSESLLSGAVALIGSFIGKYFSSQLLLLALPTLFRLTFFALLNRWLVRHYMEKDRALH